MSGFYYDIRLVDNPDIPVDGKDIPDTKAEDITDTTLNTILNE